MEAAQRILQLKSLRRDALKHVADRMKPQVKHHRNLTKEALATRIVQAETAEALANPVQPDRGGPGDGSPKQGPAGPSPAMAGLLGADKKTVSDPNTQNRGGARPGAGRPQGATEVVCSWSNLPNVPNPAIRAAVEGVFNLWAASMGVQALALSKEEAMRLSLSYTRISVGMGWDKVIHPATAACMMAAWDTANIIAAKYREATKVKPDLGLRIKIILGKFLSLFIRRKKQNGTSDNKADIRQAGFRENRIVSQPDGTDESSPIL